MTLRARAERDRLLELLEVMRGDVLAPREHVEQLREELARHHKDDRFLRCESMGELVEASLSLLEWEAG